MKTSNEKIKVALIDDHRLFREGVKRILNADYISTIVAEADDGSQVVELVEKYSPDVILMDINMAEMDGLEATKLVSDNYPDVKVIMLSIQESKASVTKAIKHGAKGYLLKEVDTESLIEAIQIVYDGGAYLHPKITHHVVDLYQEVVKEDSNLRSFYTEHRKPLHLLTKRECEVLQLLSEGHSNRNIAELLLISEKTVKNHVSNILQKLEVKDRTQAVVMAIHNGWVKIERE